MAALSYIFSDSALTTPVDDATGLTAAAVTGDSIDGVFYVGLTDASNQIQAQSDPGVDQITISISDSDGATGAAASEIKLALSNGALGSATGGASLDIGATIAGGSGNAVEVHWRWTNGAGSGDYTDLSLDVPALVESAI